MVSVSLKIAALEQPSWLEELWNASSGTATLWQTTLIALCLSLLASLITHALTKRRENSRWAKQNTLQALHRATDSFYAAREHYGHLIHTDPSDLLLNLGNRPSPPLNAVRDWNPLRHNLQRMFEALIDVQLSAGKYQKRVRAMEDLAENLAAKLDETEEEYTRVGPEGQEIRGAGRKSEQQYFQDSRDAIARYENAFLQLREDITADLTASWRNRQRRKLEQWRDLRK